MESLFRLPLSQCQQIQYNTKIGKTLSDNKQWSVSCPEKETLKKCRVGHPLTAWMLASVNSSHRDEALGADDHECSENLPQLYNKNEIRLE